MVEYGPFNVSVVPWIVAAAAIMLRIYGLMVAMPFWNRRAVPGQIRFFIIFFFTVSTTYALGFPTISEPTDVLGWLFVLVPEFICGLALGMFIRIIVAIVEGVGQIAAMTIGLGFAMLVDPNTGNQTGAITQVLSVAIALLFVSIDAHLYIYQAFVETYATVGPGSAHQLIGLQSLESIVSLGGRFFVLSLRMAGPVMATGLMIYTVLGVISKVSPQMNLFAFGFIFTIGGGIIVLTAEMPDIMRIFTHEFEEIPRNMLLWTRTGKVVP